jgi:hypothetical protein
MTTQTTQLGERPDSDGVCAGPASRSRA